MGFRLGSIDNLPVLKAKSYYVFILGSDRWKGGDLRLIEANFNKIAERLGSNGAIVMGHERVDLSPGLIDLMYDEDPNGIEELISEGDKRGGAILITGKHPSEMKPYDLILFSPLSHLINNFGGVDYFLTELCNYVDKPNDKFPKMFRERYNGPFKKLLKIFELKPNIFGIGINLNALLEPSTTER